MRTVLLAALASLVPLGVDAQRVTPPFPSLPEPVLVLSLRTADIGERGAFNAVPFIVQQASCDDSRVHGRADAIGRHGTSGWFLGGVGSGLLLGLIGTAIITGAASSTHPQPVELPTGFDHACYREGYSGKAKSKNTVSALTGGLVGTAVFVVIYVSAVNN